MKKHLLKSFGVQNAMDESQIKSILSEKMEVFDLAGYRYSFHNTGIIFLLLASEEAELRAGT